MQGKLGFMRGVNQTSTQLIGDPSDFGEPSFQSTQSLGREDQRADKARGEKLKAEAASVWTEPNRTVLHEKQETKCVYNIYRGGHSILPVGEHHEGYVTLEEKTAVEENVGKYTRGLKISIEGNIGSGKWNWRRARQLMSCCAGKSSFGPWLCESLRKRGIKSWFRPERIEEWTLGGVSLLDLPRVDPRCGKVRLIIWKLK